MTNMDKDENKQSGLKVIWKVAANIVFAVLIIVGLAIAISLLPIKNNYKLFAVMSGSMEPAISTGSVVVVKPAIEYEINQIITFEKINAQGKKENTTHRLIDIDRSSDGKSAFTTKGDANNANDFEQITQSQVLGRVLFSLPLIGYVLGYIKTLPGLVLIIIVPAAIIIYEESRKIHREAKEILRKRREAKESKNKKMNKNSLVPKKSLTKKQDISKKKKGGKSDKIS